MKSTKEKIESQLETLSGFFGTDLLTLDQGSEMWHTIKLGCQSASNAGKIIAGEKTETLRIYICQLVAQVATKQAPQAFSAALDWGNNNEAAARSAYELESGKTVTEYPFIFGDETLRYGFSPDGIVFNENGEIDRLTEIKCPYNSENFIKFVCDGIIKPEYKHQCQFAMFVSGAELIDFGMYDYRCSSKPIHWVTIERDEKAIERFKEAIARNNEFIDNKLTKLELEFGSQWR